MEENKLIYNDPEEPRPLSLAKFLKSSARIDKRLLGDFISKPENLELLKAFMTLMDFKGVRTRGKCRVTFGSHLTAPSQKPVAEAMRELLETFRLPGESQQINRITETFAEVYFATGPGTCAVCRAFMTTHTLLDEVKSQDAVYVLAYSIIMLNTDQHNPQIRVSRHDMVFSFSY